MTIDQWMAIFMLVLLIWTYLSQNLHRFHMEMPLNSMKTIPHLDITSSFEVWRLSYRVCYCSAWVAKRCAVLKVVSWPHCRPKSLPIEGQWTVITFCNGGQISHKQGFHSVSKVYVGEADTLVYYNNDSIWWDKLTQILYNRFQVLLWLLCWVIVTLSNPQLSSNAWKAINGGN